MNEIQTYKGRVIDPGKPVRVYRNLNKKCVVWSVKQGPYVVAHATSLQLMSCEFVINRKAQQRIRQTKVREVHAYVEGLVLFEKSPGWEVVKMPDRIFYSPLKNDDFVINNDKGRVIETANFIWFDETGCHLAGLRTT